jgi:indolepyruvate ferredoxin oxidoreductase, alpha subunit
MIQAAFELSEQFHVPVFLRLTTRTSHASTLVDVGPDFAPRQAERKPYVKDIKHYVQVPMFARPARLNAEVRTRALRDFACESPFNRIEMGSTKLGIITAGVTYQHVKEVFPEFSVLKLGLSNPLPAELIRKFAAQVEQVLVVEELDPVLEEQVRALGIKVLDHTTELSMMELIPMRLLALRKELLGDVELPVTPRADAGLPTRPPVLCSGCSHRGVFYLLNKLGATVAGDIGCYTLGAFPPLSSMDTTICMGASIGNAFGMEKAGLPGRKCAVIGDSTFFHSGLTGILDVLYNNGKLTTIVLDNSITGMTGHQENPGSGTTLAGDAAPVTDIALLAKGMGFKRVVRVNAYDLKVLEQVLIEALDAAEPSVIIAYGPCRISAKLMNAGTFAVDSATCKACGACFKLGCPAIERGEAVADGKRFKAHIDPVQCSGCNLCKQVCKFNAISQIR